MSEEEALLTLYLIPHIGPSALMSLKEQFGSYGNALASSIADWPLHSAAQQSAHTFLQSFSLTAFLTDLQKLKQHYITWDDPHYPNLLRQIQSPPPILFFSGNRQLLGEHSIAVVGTRHPTPYAQKVIQQIVPQLVANQRVITSGFQRGVDQLAHAQAIQSGGSTIAVLGTGIDVNYPLGSKELKQKLVHTNNLFISEFPPGTQPHKGNFPRRNRIVSGLSDAVVIIEAAEKSGSLVTAQHAIEQGREVCAIPGSIFSQASSGPHYLIKNGARLVTSAAEILGKDSQSSVEGFKKEVNLHGWQKELYEFILSSPTTLDDCIERLQRPTIDIITCLTELELSGSITKRTDGLYEAI